MSEKVLISQEMVGEMLARYAERGATSFDKLCHKVFAANGNGTDFLSRGTGQRCRRCGNDLEAYYCESRLFMVECHSCKIRALVMAGNAQEAAYKTFGIWGGIRMKILKPGKVEQRKFVCPKCGCIFVASKAEIDTDIDPYVCPQEGCNYYVMAWADGELYEEPVPLPDDRVRARLMEIADEWNRLHFGGVGKCVDFLMEKGVTIMER